MDWHQGERELQTRAGLHKGASLRRAIHDRVSRVAAEFLREQTLAFITTLDGAGWPRVSTLAGPPGFFAVGDDRTLEIASTAIADPSVAQDVEVHPHVGLLAIDFATRRRLRLNGRAETRGDGTLVVRADEIYGNCSKYIQTRVREVTRRPAEPHPQSVTRELSARQQGAVFATKTKESQNGDHHNAGTS